MSIPRPKPSITTTDGLHAGERCYECRERKVVMFKSRGRSVCEDCRPRHAGLIRVVRSDDE